MVKAHIEYAGQLRCIATHGPSGAKIETDAPVDNHGRGEAFSPTDLCAFSLGVCMATVMGIAAGKRGIDLTGMTMDLTKEMSADAPRRIVRIGVEVRMPIPPDPALESVAMNCPVMHSLHPDIKKDVAFVWSDR